MANGYKVDYDAWHAAVHGSLPYDQYLQVGPACRSTVRLRHRAERGIVAARSGACCQPACSAVHLPLAQLALPGVTTVHPHSPPYPLPPLHTQTHSLASAYSPALPCAAQADPKLRELLLSIPLPKFVFTNADRTHARRCLDLLGIADCFERVIAFEDVMEAAEQVGL